MTGHRVVLITGTSSQRGLGYATSRVLASRGHTVYATVRDIQEAADVAAGAGPGRVVVRTLDLLDRAAMAPLLAEIIATEGRIDAIINNAGYGVIGGVEQVELDVAKASFETNVWGTMSLVQEAMPLLRQQGHGHLLLVSSCFVAGLPTVAMGYYLAAKAALETLFYSLAAEAAPFGVKVTCFQPGPIMTDLRRVWGDRIPPGGDPRPQLVDDLYNYVTTAAPALQQPEEAATALADLIRHDPPLAAASSPDSTAYAARALRDSNRFAEFSQLLAATNSQAPNTAM
ncbi:SDR family NAD(P)-dependent oxidoreductase [Mycobacterium camsae]|uniref:SDR family NAD(P)-dependent oxidoreductase n=1 Tax=Mycobacterium gordonae TaxID=1778 RepID=UPI00198045D0|nr:SDR family NAD(P)-dependent oxidoreductase [Mycobacterium gordonae]